MATAKKKSAKSEKAEPRAMARAYTPLINRHRPKTFKEMIGMRSTVDAIEKSILNGEIPNAYLLMGATGCGKTTFARVIARTVMCETYNGCGKCSSCETFDKNPDSHMSYTEVNCGSDGKIDDIRNLIQLSHTSPMMGKMRVIVLDEAHRLTPASVEALLKPLEEPSESTLWILATTESQALKDTLKNRCNLVYIKPADREQLSEYLAELAREYMDYAAEELAEITDQIAEITGGYIRSSLSTLDVVIKSYRASGGKLDIQEFIQAVRDDILKNTDADALSAQKIVMALLLGNPKIILNILADHDNFVGLSRNIMDTAQYLMDDAFGARGSNIYHPVVFQDTASTMREKLKERDVTSALKVLGIYTILCNGAVNMHTEVMRFAVPERHLISARLMNLLSELRQIVPKKSKGTSD